MKLRNFLKNTKLIGIILVGIILLVAIVLLIKLSLTNTTAKTGGREGYTRIESVPGVGFEVSQNLCDYATAVLAVTKDVDFVKNASYSYKNGTDTYMLFNMTQYIIVCKKGTSFNLANTDVKTALESNSLGGIWFENGSNLSKNSGKCSLDVTAQVVITNTIYNDFVGKLVTITENGEEWSLFIGSVNAEDESMKDMIKYVASSFVLDSTVDGDDEVIYEIPVEEKPKLKPVETVKVEVQEQVEEAPVIEPDDKQDSSANVVTEEPKKEEKEPKPIKEPEKTEEPSKIEPEAPVEEIPVVEIEVTDDQIATAEYNQKLPEYEDKNTEDSSVGYTSSVYSMLGAGIVGYATSTNQMLGTYDEIFIRADEFNGEAVTKQLINEYIESGDAYYNTMDAPLGTHWESVTYSVKYDEQMDYYVNVSFVGLDGEKLKYRGISYSMKTYDILNKITIDSNGWRTGYIAFYAVPNGCQEYALAFGDEMVGNGYRAYYRVK